MATHHHAGGHGDRTSADSNPTRVWLIRLLMVALLGVGAFYIIAEHGAHALSAWPLIILLACPLLHLLMHGGHGGHGGHAEKGTDPGAANG